MFDRIWGKRSSVVGLGYISCIVGACLAVTTPALATDLFLSCNSTNVKSHETEHIDWEITDANVFMNGSKSLFSSTISATAIEIASPTRDWIYKVSRVDGSQSTTFVHPDKAETTWYGSCEKAGPPATKF